MRRTRRTEAAAIALPFVIALAFAASLARADDPAAVMLGQPAPSFRLTDVRTGEPVSLEDFRGRFVVLHFGASW